MLPAINTVEEFKNAWLMAGCPIRPPFKDAIFTTDIAWSVVLYRAGSYQVELYICKANTEAPFHCHPGVDSFFIFLGGNIDSGREDKTFTDLSQFQRPRPDGAHCLLGFETSALNGALHSLRVGPEGGAFLSFEKWNDKEPTSVAVNWEGEVVGSEHEKMLKAGA